MLTYAAVLDLTTLNVAAFTKACPKRAADGRLPRVC
jgi:hypothetical protein